MAKQKTIGNNPLHAYLSTEATIQPNTESVYTAASEEQAPVKKQRVTIHIASDIVERVKNAVFWEPGLTLAGFAEYAFETAIKQMESDRGAQFPQRRHPLRSGRPL